VLYSSAATLRPLIDGASWTFVTRDKSGSGVKGFTRTQKADLSGTFTETDSDDPNTSNTISADSVSGQINISTLIDTGLPIAKLPINGPELKSPVRANDQVVLLDRHVSDIGVDVDKDGKNDAMDIAMYRVIIGNETLTLPNRSATLTALRVDTTAAVRLIPSGGGPATVNTQVQSVWYAPGVGIVRQVLQGTTASGPYTREDFLLGFDGVSNGWGVVTRVAQTTNDFLPPASAALPLVNGVLVATSGQSVFQLDSLGRVVAKRTYADYGLPSQSSINWMRTSAGPRLAVAASSGNSNSTAVSLYALNSDGSPGVKYLGDVDVFSQSPKGAFNLGGSLVGAPASSILWGVGTRQVVSAGNTSTTVIVRRYDSSGTSIGGEISLPTVVHALSVQAQVTASGVLLSWSDVTPTSTYSANAQAFVRNDGSIAWQTQIPLQTLDSVSTMMPFASDTGALWLLWTNGFSSIPSSPTAQGLSLDTSGVPIGVALDANFFANTKLSIVSSPPLLSVWPNRIAVKGSDLWVGGAGSGFAFSGDTDQSRFVELAHYSMGSGNPSTGMTLVSDTVIPGGAYLPVAPIDFNDHTLLLTDDGQHMRATIVWK